MLIHIFANKSKFALNDSGTVLIKLETCLVNLKLLKEGHKSESLC